MASLKILYSSGSKVTAEYAGITRRSIGGIITDVEVPSTLKNLFGTVSLRMLSNGVKDYRCVFLKNSHATNNITTLRLYADVPLVAAVTNPTALAPAPVLGDKWVVPTGGAGAWSGKAGKLATYNGTGWTFSFAPFASYRFGFVAPIDITLGDDLYEESYVRTTENIFNAPAGISFVSVDGVANITTIGSGALNSGKKLGMWIERTINKYIPSETDLTVNEGGIKLDESIPVKFLYDI